MADSEKNTKFTVSITPDGRNALDSIITLTNRNPNREQSVVIDEAIKAIPHRKVGAILPEVI